MYKLIICYDLVPIRNSSLICISYFYYFSTAPEDDSSSTEENKTDPSCDDSQEGGQHAVPTVDFAKLKPTPKPRFSTDNNNDVPLSSPEYNKKTQTSTDSQQHFGETSNACAVATKLNSCTSSEKSSDSGVSSSSSSVCFGNMSRGKRIGANQLNKNNFGGHLAQNVKDS